MGQGPAAEQRQPTPPSLSPSPSPPPPPRSASPFRGSLSRDDSMSPCSQEALQPVPVVAAAAGGQTAAAAVAGEAARCRRLSPGGASGWWHAPFSMWSGAAVSTLSAFSQTSPPAPPTTPVQLSPPTDATAEGVTVNGEVRDGCGCNRVVQPPLPPSGLAPVDAAVMAVMAVMAARPTNQLPYAPVATQVEAPPRGLVEGLAHPANVSGFGGDSITSRRTTVGVTALDADTVPQIPSTGSGRRHRGSGGGCGRVAASTGIEGGTETLEVNSGAPVGRTADRRMGRAAAAAAAGVEAALPRPEFMFGEPRSLHSRRCSSMAVVVAAGAGSDTSNAAATTPPAVHLQYENSLGVGTPIPAADITRTAALPYMSITSTGDPESPFRATMAAVSTASSPIPSPIPSPSAATAATVASIRVPPTSETVSMAVGFPGWSRGRWGSKGMPPTWLCDCGVVEDEMHVFVECPAYNTWAKYERDLAFQGRDCA
ncbi:hypothetical protein VOLCADRAFT_98400 [Volvox carteri f. nagariensis]|uniref:Uncharacterized protein n=1 Tax=Volvox carteri f. nagariensis TaxID=3068 RepID=D8UF88_VOLCA|nr:uncharacterized protein VOLCADRAFT_98400 [Volvox carteri f. nagariensis]EFJ41640.1 hypothetical protein VOLCADRAFT_98400 [Volvox carteri f. nagariensis]|eukprot:XP_002957296.1 hypothetical protein VOLCADRAFT_98400 [Volvox carteri f. nagariensis]